MKILKSLSAYCTIHLITASLLRKYKVVPPERIHILAEKLPSTINALLTSTITIYLLFIKKHFSKSWLKVAYPNLLDYAYAGHIGYTLYDILVMLLDKETSHISSWAHHVFGVLGISVMRMYKTAFFLPTCFLPAEATVVVTNLIYLVQLFCEAEREGTRDLMGGLLGLRCLAFTVLRLMAGPLCFYWMVQTTSVDTLEEDLEVKDGQKKQPDHHTVVPFSRKLSCLMDQYSKLPVVIKYGCLGNTVLFTFLNTYWTGLTYRALWRHLRKSKNKVVKIHHI